MHSVRDRETVLERAREYLESARRGLDTREFEAGIAEDEAAKRLAQSFAGYYEAAADVAPVDGQALADARQVVQRAESALSLLESEAETAQQQLDAAQERVARAVWDVIRAEILQLGRKAAEHDRQAAQLRVDLQAAGHITADLQRKHGWRGQVFTTTAREALQPDPNARPPAASADWRGFISRLDQDPEAQLE
jgi:hypothetical protein